MIAASPSAVPSDRFRADGWVRTATFRLLDQSVVVHSDSAPLVEALDELFADAAGAGLAASDLALGRALGPRGPGYFLAADGAVLVRNTAPTVVFRHLVFQLNQLAIASAPGPRLHAAAAAAGGRAIVIPGSMGAGKSTLVAGLVRRGLGYLTDEVVAFDADGLVRPYPKPVSLTPGEGPHADVDWTPPPGSERFVGASGIVPPGVLGAVERSGCEPALVVLPTYEPAAATVVEELHGAAALAAVAADCFDPDAAGVLARLDAILGSVPCIRVRSGDLGAVCDVVRDRLGGGA